VHSFVSLPRGTKGLDRTSLVYSLLLDSLIASSSGVERVMLLVVSSPHSGVWIKALPSHSLGLCLGNNERRIAIGLRTGVNLVLPQLCICGVSKASISCRRRYSTFTTHYLPSTGLLP